MGNETLFGYTGKLLRVNLSTGAVTTEDLDKIFLRRYLGGTGFLSYYLLKETQKGLDPLGPENKIIFALGPVSGTTMLASGRNAVGAKSPQSGGIAISQVGEFWGAEMKRAGYDIIIVEGRSEKPVYLWINDEKTEIREAGHLWGKETKETQQAIRNELGDQKIRVAMIGPAGENMVKFACIMCGLFDAAGRGGLGAVMGSKNLKAVAIRGQKMPAVADPDKIKEINRWYSDMITKVPILRGWHEAGTGFDLDASEATGDLPVRNWYGGPFPEAKAMNGVSMKKDFGLGMESCYACPVRCKKRLKATGKYTSDPDYGGPEYEAMGALGSNVGVTDASAVIKANEICNAYGIDVISTGGVISFVMECFEKGLLTAQDTGGLEIRFGDAEAVMKCIHLIAKREGFGKLMAEGTAKMAARVGGNAWDFAMQVKNIDPGMHEPRLSSGMGLGFMINPHGADHCCNVIDVRFSTDAGMVGANPLGFLETFPPGDISPRKVALFRMEHLRQVLYDCFLLCHLAAAPYTIEKLTEVLRAVTGWNTGPLELVKMAERALTLARLFNVREGFTPDDDVLPRRYYQDRPGTLLTNPALFPEKMEKAKRYYYTLMGWDSNTGIPLPEKLNELSIPF